MSTDSLQSLTLNHSRSIREVLAQFAIQAPDIQLSELVLDSRQVNVHTGFVAIKGHSLDGRGFVPQAISLGAKVIILEANEQEAHGQISMREQTLLIEFYQLAEKLSQLAVAFYQAPAEKLTVTAVTGTNGKTSTVQFCAQLNALLGQSSASIGTLGVKTFALDGQQLAETEFGETQNTTPDAMSLQALLSDLQASEVSYVAMEASSHALVQGRMRAMHTDVAVFTNLTRDHLDYHGSMANYAAAKRQLLQQPGLKHLVLNFDDAEHKRWIAHKLPEQEVVLCSVEQSDCKTQAIAQGHHYCLASQIEYLPAGVNFTLETSWGDVEISLALIGHFNIANVLAALACSLVQGAELSALAQACRQLRPVDGRMEIFAAPGSASIVVDYAHTPDALAQVLDALRKHSHQQIWCVFGCGGDRDKGKRSLMGEIAENKADQIILTNDNSRTEAPENIIQDILSGCREPDAIDVEMDRQQAIKNALARAQQDDLILIAGKGHEDYQIIGEQRVHYDERAFVRQLLGESQHD